LSGPAGLARPLLGLGTGPDGDPLYGVFWLIAALPERAPAVIGVADLHWVDVESARFFAYLARRLEGMRILLPATARPDEPRTSLGRARARGAQLVPTAG
jgi:hypothetical protein